jgi:tetratricopeptide (TPR) repeat protein
MKNLLKLFLFVIPIYSIAQTKQDSINARVQLLIEKNNNKTISKEDKQDLLNYGYKIQNKGMYLEEYKHDYINAIPHIEKAIQFWIAIKDTANEANLRKYKGYLLGNVGEFEEGKKEIHQAINLFKKVHYDPQYEMVCLYDLSLLYDKENKLDSALYYEKMVNNFHASDTIQGRLFTSNTHLTNLYRKLKDYQQAEKFQIKNEQIPHGDYHWDPLINFYYVSYMLYTETNQTEKAEKFKKLYDNVRLDFRNDNKFEITSIFE